MAPIKTEAIVLKKHNFRETSVILSLYTENAGKIKCILKGVRAEKSKIPPLAFTPGAYIHASVYLKQNSELNLLSSPSLLQYYDLGYKKNLIGWRLILNIVDLFTPEREKDENIFSLLRETSEILAASANPEVIFVAFKIKFIKILGYGIELSRCVVCRKESKAYMFSGKLGGLICEECKSKDPQRSNILKKVINVMQQMDRMDIKKCRIIKHIPVEILHKINFYANITLNYHSEIDKIWWSNEKNIL
ncbi:MAG: DNA repair protein RecO [Elusimicrobia bacterium]|jgi:DNA repair protein RecO (recombination protein O)|nr:DNA repair protein RecO [Elusimicrobiota bacterium]